MAGKIYKYAGSNPVLGDAYMPRKTEIPKKNVKEEKTMCCRPNIGNNYNGSAVYGLGFIGAVVYYVSTATSFWMGALGVLKAMVWPAFLVYGLLKTLGM